MLRPRCALVAALAAAGLVSTSAAVAGPPGSTVILTRPAGFGPLTPPSVNDSSAAGALSAPSIYGESHPGFRAVGGPGGNSSRYVVFLSAADGLVADDNDTVENVYVRDTVNDTTALVSRATDGTAANGSSFGPAISANGQYVVFGSSATNLVPNVDPANTQQIYRRDMISGTTTLISRAEGAAGAIADSDAYEATVANDGSVAFRSYATNLGTAGGHSQVYLRDGNHTVLVSHKQGSATTGGDDNSLGPSISDDGAYVAFTTAATDVGAADGNGDLDVFRFATGTGSIDLVSVRTISPNAGTYGNGDSSGASISGDGTRVAFTSSATNLSALDANNGPDVYVHDFSGTPVTFLASQGGGVKANGFSAEASISANGAKIAFLTDATNLAAADTNGVVDVYVRDTGMFGGTALASRCQGSALLTSDAADASIAPTGNMVVFTNSSPGCSPQADPDFSQVYTRLLGLIIAGTEPTGWVSRPSGTGDFKSGTNDSAIHGFFRADDTSTALSEDGSVAAFVSEANELSPVDGDTFPNVFVRENKTGVTDLISRASGADGAAGDAPSGPSLHRRGLVALGSSGPQSPPSISADGRYVAFTSAADNLVPSDGNGRTDVFVRDRVAQTTTLVSVKSDGTQVNAHSFAPSISADGNRVAFVSLGMLDPSVDLSTDGSVYVRDIAAGTTTLASRQSGSNADANSDAATPAISGDGNRVAFVTDATNLAPSLIDGNGVDDVYVHDLADGTTVLASTRNGLPTAGDHGALAADLDFAGTHVAFSSTSSDIVGAADSNGVRDIFLHTLGTTDTTLVSQGPGGAAGNSSSADPSISADGNRVAFDSIASDIVPGAGGQTVSILLRDIAAGTTTLVSRADGVDGAGANGISRFASISADGHCVAFDSQADNLVGGPPGTDFTRGYMRAIDGDCGTPPPPVAPIVPDTTPPAITGLKVSPATFAVSARSTAVSARKRKKVPKGTKIRFKLSEAAKVSLKIELKGKGRKKGKKCVAKRRTGKRCTLYKAKGTLKRNGRAGANTVAFSGRIGRKKLGKGRYRITATATDPAGNKAKKKTVAFRVV